MTYGFVYMWTNLKNGMKYIGSHHGKEDDGYIGSGVYFRIAYDKHPEHFARTILEINDVVDDVNYTQALEQKYFDQVENINLREDYYNLSPTAANFGGWRKGLTKKDRPSFAQTEDTRLKISNAMKTSHASGARDKCYEAISLSKIGKNQTNDPGRKATADKMKGNKNSAGRSNTPKNTIWITDGTTSKMIQPDDLHLYPTWRKGRK